MLNPTEAKTMRQRSKPLQYALQDLALEGWVLLHKTELGNHVVCHLRHSRNGKRAVIEGMPEVQLGLFINGKFRKWL